MCVQIFYCVASCFTYVIGMRGEAHSHGAYQDFVREIGAPNFLITNNSKTHTGKKRQKTSRDNVTRQVNIAPHNQQQNQSERQIGHVKHRMMQAFNYSGAPIEFWCYCMYFIVDCLNHTSKKSLDYRAAMEKLYRSSPDISIFHVWISRLYDHFLDENNDVYRVRRVQKNRKKKKRKITKHQRSSMECKYPKA
jgi:hypothetical protein